MFALPTGYHSAYIIEVFKQSIDGPSDWSKYLAYRRPLRPPCSAENASFLGGGRVHASHTTF